MRDHHHYHYLFAKQRPTLGPILIGSVTSNEQGGPPRLLEDEKEEGERVNTLVKSLHTFGDISSLEINKSMSFTVIYGL